MKLSMAVLCIALLCGCATTRELYEQSKDGIAKMQTYATTDPAVLRERWGPYAVAATGKNWINSTEQRKYEWVLPGVILKETRNISFLDKINSTDRRLQYDPQSGHIQLIEVTPVDRRASVPGQLLRDFVMQPDGSLFDEQQGDKISIREDGSLVLGSSTYQSVIDEEYARAGERMGNVAAEIGTMVAEHEAKKRAKERSESAAFWDGVIGGTLAAAQGVAQGYAEAQASRSTGPTAGQIELAAMTRRQQERARLAGHSTGQGSAAPQVPQARTPKPILTASRSPVAIASTAPSRPAPIPAVAADASADSSNGGSRGVSNDAYKPLADSASTVNSENLACRPVPQKLSVVKTSQVSEDDARGQLESDRFPQCVRGPARRLDTVDCRTEKDLPRIDANGHQVKEAPSYLYRCFATWVCQEGKLDCGPSRPASASRQ